MERWKPVTYSDYSDSYEVSDLGRVRSIARQITDRDGFNRTLSGRLLKPSMNTHGYLFVTLSANGKTKKATLHDLVARAFIGPPPKINTASGRVIAVRHCNGDQTNNRKGNLRWGTYLRNETDKLAHGTKALGRAGRTKLTLHQVVSMRRMKVGSILAPVAEEYGVSISQVQRICAHKVFNVEAWLDMLEAMVVAGNTGIESYIRHRREAGLLLSEPTHPKHPLLVARFRALPRQQSKEKVVID